MRMQVFVTKMQGPLPEKRPREDQKDRRLLGDIIATTIFELQPHAKQNLARNGS